MAEDLGQSRTEAPTPRRREDARERGQVAVSHDLTGGLLLVAGVLFLLWSGRGLGLSLLRSVTRGLTGCRHHDLGTGQTQILLSGVLTDVLRLTGPLLALAFVLGVGILVGQVGFRLVPGLAAPNWEKIDPSAGLGRMLSLAGVVRGLAAILKVGVAGLLMWLIVRGRYHQLTALGQLSLFEAVGVAWGVALRLALVIAAALVVLGVFDYGYQRFRLEQALRMSRQELKDEVKREEGDPQIKARIRKLARDMSQRRMMSDVPRASVVITNPTHLAVALRYDRSQPAPRVVAKGAGHIARRIVETARRHAVPVVERKPVAQALYRAVKVGQEIPAALFQAVAEVLAYIYRLRGIA